MIAIKVTTVGNSVGMVLPKELLEQLRIKKGDMLQVIETPDDMELTPYKKEFAQQVDVAKRITRQDRDVLHKWAESIRSHL